MLAYNTFGIEAEYDRNSAALIAALHREGFAASDTLHSYHCDCSSCDGPSIFRGQQDSTCSGEIISTIFTLKSSPWKPAIEALETLAVEVDAEPGFDSGLHVHVGTEHLTFHKKAQALWAFMRWEGTLARLASGRFPVIRNNNQSMQSALADILYVQSEGLEVPDRANSLTRMQVIEDSGFAGIAKRAVLHEAMSIDRHVALSTATRFNTWEFRLWNSTRSAWRMELFVRLSMALVDPEVTLRMLEVERDSLTTGTLRGLMYSAGYRKCATLIERQEEYMGRAQEVPSSLSLP